MKSLLLKDLYLTKNNKKSVILIFLFLIISIIANSSSTSAGSVSIYLVLFSTLYVLFSISFASLYYDDASKFNEYIKYIPINIKTYVKSKYYFALIVYLFELLIISILSTSVFGLESVNIALMIVSAEIITGSVLIYIFFKHGQDKMRQVITVLFMITFVILMGMLKFGSGVLSIALISVDVLKIIIPIISLIVSFLVFYIFMKLTIRMEEIK